ncbi:hypothetical protein BGZ99_001437, partial [Dissophora globulifera]
MGWHNFTWTKNKLLSHNELVKRLRYLPETVFVAIDERARTTQERTIQRFNASVLNNDFPDGAKVMTLDPILGDKFRPRYKGPYTVVRRNQGGTYELKDGTRKLLPRHYAPSQLKFVIDDL